MAEPEVEYRRLTSGDLATLRDRVDVLRGAGHDLDGARDDITDAVGVPVWTGGAANAFHARGDGLSEGCSTASAVVARACGSLRTAAQAYDVCTQNADGYIAAWRNRPTGWPPFVEDLFARMVSSALVSEGTTYNEQLGGVLAVLQGKEVDLDELDEDTREWVEGGLAQNDDWLSDNGSSLGPMIPNTAATGDGRGLVPQGLGYDPRSGSLLQAYDAGDGSGIAVIDERSGAELGEVTLGGSDRDADGNPIPGGQPPPSHAGGVTVVGDDVFVTDNGALHTYSLADIRTADGGTVSPSAPPSSIDGGSYVASANGLLYSGEFSEVGSGLLHVYRPDGEGGWDKIDEVVTPPRAQGVVVRDGEYVFSTSYGRHGPGALHVVGKDGSDEGSYPLPNMSQGVVEVDGELVTTYESGAGKFSEATFGGSGWFWGVPDDHGLWANPYMTRTPLDELGLDEPIEMEPETLDRGAADLEPVATTLAGVATELDGVRVPAAAFGQVPAAARLATAVTDLLDGCAEQVRLGSRAVDRLADELRESRRGMEQTDEQTAAWMSPGQRGR